MNTTKTDIPAPELPSPELAPATEDTGVLPRPDVWNMPTTGMEWCDCEHAHHDVTEAVIRRAIRRALGRKAGHTMTHVEICQVLMELWCYIEVCDFFHDHVILSARTVYGSVEVKYPIKDAIEIIAYFSKTWHGCPAEACEGGFDAAGPIA